MIVETVILPRKDQKVEINIQSAFKQKKMIRLQLTPKTCFFFTFI